jgi:glycosyltransferase involved in cell wall biosynthesis
MIKKKTIFFQTTNLNTKNGNLNNRFRNLLLNGYDKIIVTNSKLYEELGKPKKFRKIFKVYPGSGINYGKTRKTCQFKTIIFAGHWSYIKGTDLVLEIAKKMPHIVFRLVAGMGKYCNDKSLYDQYLKHSSYYRNVEVVPYTSNPIKYFENSDLMILPYRTGEGVLGIAQSAIEAMALGIPILATNNSSIRDILKNGKNGFFCESIQEYLHYISEIMNNDILYEKLSEGCIATYREKFIAKNIAEDIIGIIKNESI